jgi:tetraacyldisaccharide 4'-kinase
LFTRDFYLPTGDLRDLKSRAKDADIIVVTKCKPDLSEVKRQQLLREINPAAHQQVFFTTIEYGTPYHILQRDAKPVTSDMEVLLVCGIANPEPLKQYLQEHTKAYLKLSYNDHHIFTIDDLREMIRKYEQLGKGNNIILTTEKDAVRLLKFSAALEQLPVYVIPVEHRFLFGEGNRFNDCITGFIDNFNK